MSRSTPVAPSELEVYPTRESLPQNPPAGTYVVVDVMYFSTTVVELLAGGASCVHVPLAGSDPTAFKRVNPEAHVGGEGTGDGRPLARYDFFNSLSDTRRLDLAGRPVSMTSDNGGRTVADLRTTDGCTVLVGSTTNAAAVGSALRRADGPLALVCAGSGGAHAPEDHLGARLIAHHATGHGVDSATREAFRDRLTELRGPLDSLPRVRQRDILEYVAAIDSRSIVPELDGDRLVDTSDRFERVCHSPAVPS